MSFLIGVFTVLSLVLWVWAIIDLWKSSFTTRVEKGFWLLAILAFPILGPLVYFQAKRKTVHGGKRNFEPNFNYKEHK